MKKCKNLEGLFHKAQYEFIPLQLDSVSIPFVGMKLIVYNNYFALGDNYYEHTVSLYDDKGNYCGRIGKKGNGPNEYPVFKDFSIWKDTICIASTGNSGDCFYQYNLNGEMIKKIEIQEKVISFARNLKGDYLINSGRNVYNSHWQLTLYDSNFEKLTQFIKLNEEENNVPIFENNFSVNENCFYFHEAFNNQLYILKGKGMEPSFYIDLGSKNNFEGLHHENFIDAVERLQKQGFYLLNSYIETDSLVCTSLTYLENGENKSQSVLIYNKTKEKGNVLELHNADLFMGNICIANGILYCLVSDRFVTEIANYIPAADSDIFILKLKL